MSNSISCNTSINSININEQNLVPISELPFQYNISTIETIEAKEKNSKKEKMVKSNRQQTVESKSQFSLEQWFSPTSKKNNPGTTEDNSTSLVTVIDLTENSNSEISDVEINEELKNEEIIVLRDNKQSNINKTKLSLRKSITPKKICKPTSDNTKKNKSVIKSPYFSRKTNVFNEKSKFKKMKIKDKDDKEVIDLIDSVEENEDSEDTIQDSELDFKQDCNDSSSTEQDNETISKTDNEEDSLNEDQKVNDVLTIDNEESIPPVPKTEECNYHLSLSII